MSNRATRRAAERLARNAAVPTPATNISDAQLAANRANSQLSTGPKSETGKLISSHNALKTGLTGRTIVLPTDDVAAYQSLVAIILQKFAPANDYEKHLVQTIADTEWRLLRIPTLESGLYALGRAELAAEFEQQPDPQLRATIIEAHIFRTYEKDFRNLALQERRLRSQLKQITAELRTLQEERRAEAEAAKAKAKDQSAPAKPANGFEFSTPPIPSVPAPPQPAQPGEMAQEMEAAA